MALRLNATKPLARMETGSVAIDNQWFVTGSATGKNRKDLNYSMSITNKWSIKNPGRQYQVYMAVQGIKELVVENKKITIDYETVNATSLLPLRSKQIQNCGSGQ